MSKLHILAGNPVSNEFTIVVHAPTPGTNNTAGFSWSSVLVAAGRATTIMTEGAGPGQITTAERAGVLAGTTLEGVFSFTDDPNMAPAARLALLDAMADQVIAALQARIAAELKYWGLTRT
jgi:hypothetical protein